jgi:two-component system, OmpR family, sensor histidine kinase VicK
MLSKRWIFSLIIERLSIVVDVQQYRKIFIDIRKRGGKFRAFTEITKYKVKYCKELAKIVDEVRHLDGVKDVFNK